METNYSMEDILDFLEGRRSESDEQAFWQTVETDPRLSMDVAACRALLEAGRQKRLKKLLKEIEDFDQKLPPEKT